MSKALQVFTGESWEREVLGSKDVVLVDFWAAWCGPCRAIAPLMEALAGEYEGRARVGKLNVDEHSEVAARYGITSIPTLLLFRDGQVVEQRVGALPMGELKNLLERHLEAKIPAAS